MILLREKLAELLTKQETNNELELQNLHPQHRENQLQRAGEIITLFVDAIRKFEFKI